ncbi:MAG: ssuC 10 [Hyphomicrobiales bacterium]|jgi:ABC-type nitrate/sulfonate/bicarbonate transport system permease component|nr:ssuC 10 [Hyphomicrobiales bacterium]
MTQLLPRLAPALFLALIALVWEAASRSGFADPDVLPPFSHVMVVLWGLVGSAGFLSDLGLTALEVAVAFLIVVPLGLVAGLYLGEKPEAYRLFAPLLNLLLSVPKSIFLPIFIFAFGIGFGQKVIYAITLTFFIVVLTGIAAARSVPAGLVNMARAFGASKRQIYLEVYLPAMEPLIIEGARIGFIYTVTGVLIAEMYGSPRGIGRLMFAWGESFRMSELLASVVLVVVLTVSVNEVLRWLEDRRQAHRSRA